MEQKYVTQRLDILFELRNEDVKKEVDFCAELYAEMSDFDEAVNHGASGGYEETSGGAGSPVQAASSPTPVEQGSTSPQAEG